MVWVIAGAGRAFGTNDFKTRPQKRKTKNMATQYLSFRGKAHYCKPYEGQIDHGFEDKEDGHFANWNTGLLLDEETLRVYRALALNQVKVKENNQVTFKRSEFKRDKGQLVPLGPPRVTLPEGIEEGTAIGNGSDVTIGIEVYDYSYKNRPGKAARWNSVVVHELVEYVKPEAAPVGPAVPF